MAGPKKCTVWYNDIVAAKPCGWSEGMISNDTGTDLDAVIAAWDVVCIKREQMLGVGIQRMALRVSDVSELGDSAVAGPRPLPSNQMYNTALYNAIKALPGGLDAYADFGWTALGTRLEMGRYNRRSFPIHGNPDVFTIDTQKGIQNPIWQTAFTQWKNAVISPLWGGIVILKPLSFQTITAYGAGTWTIPGLNASIGDLVYFRGVSGTKMPKGYRRIVTKTTPDQYTIAPFDSAGAVWTGAGKVGLKSFGFRAFTNAIVQGETERKVGRPFGTCVGRRPVRLSLVV